MSHPSRLPWLQVWAALCLAWCVGMFARGYWTPDEPREADIAWRMTWQQHKAVPLLAGVAFCEKPPLTYWLAAAPMKMFGSAAWAARLPNLLYAIIAAWSVGLLAGQASGRLAGLVATAAMGTLLLSYQVAIWLATDAPLLAAASVAMLGAYRGFYGATRSAKLRGYLVMHAALGVGFLCKSAAAWLTPALGIATLIVWEKRWREVLRFELYAGLLLQAAVILPWVGFVYAGPDGVTNLKVFFWNNLAGRFAHVAAPAPLQYADAHRNSPGKYLIELPTYLYPWTLLLLAAGLSAWRQRRAPAGAGRDLPGPARDLPGAARDLPAAARDLPAAAHDLPGPARDLPGAARDLPGAAHDLPGAAQDLPGATAATRMTGTVDKSGTPGVSSATGLSGTTGASGITDATQRSVLRFAVAMTLPTLVFLSFAATARNIYLATAMPGTALLLAWWAERCARNPTRADFWSLRATSGVLLLSTAAVGGALIVLSVREWQAVPGQASFIVIALGGEAAAAYAALRAWQLGSAPALCLYALLLSFCALLAGPLSQIYRHADTWQDLGKIAREVQRDTTGLPLILLAPDETTRAVIDMYARTDVTVIPGPLDARAYAEVRSLTAAAPDSRVLLLLPRRFDLPAALDAAGLQWVKGYSLPHGRDYGVFAAVSR